ncbi:dienelactone hydrolase family protein [Actinoplanes regularis]|uniref:Carboxymethylenebutenolidase n=1 Tax=Actinoplanes regularis TaxID=52697 RepID=A0A238YRS1_9ACTN|nr:dienelactone hydrolase family protein [Actinoplanes regularis]GIE85480.1 hypothetical protein Are01nite_19600 [Actinoplanes regularis]SNR73354.1 carboxymethylenebutenolidase [Actinoplanes regularis]
MCHSTDSKPPAAPVLGTVTHSEHLALTSPDGTKVGAYLALPAEPNGRNVVILPDVRGLHAYYQELAERFAEAGFGAIVVDYYGRTAGVGVRDDEFDWQSYLTQVKPEEVALDVRAAIDQLGRANPSSFFTVGFCFGGGLSWRLAAGDLPLAGTIGFYGRPALVTDVLDRIQRPMLLLVAGDDVATPQEDFRALDAGLTAAGADYELVTYDGAPHSFFDRAYGEWRETCDDAWRQIIAFTERHGASR